MKKLYWLAAASCLALSGCGGGDGSSGGSVSPSPTPTVTPTPTPTPVPAPTPAPSTGKLSDLSSDFAFNSEIGYLTNSVLNNGQQTFEGGSLLQSGHLGMVQYYHSSERVDFGYDGSSVTFLSGDQLYQTGEYNPRWEKDKSSEEFMFFRVAAPPLKHIIVGYWKTTDRNQTTTPRPEKSQGRLVIFGQPSSESEPLSSDLQYEGQLMLEGGVPGSGKQQSPTGASSSWSYIPQTDAFRASLSFSLDGQSTSLNTTVKLNRASNRVEGEFNSSDNAYKGTFRGEMFGPKRAEFGVVFQVTRVADGALFIGNFLGIDRTAKATGY